MKSENDTPSFKAWLSSNAKWLLALLAIGLIPFLSILLKGQVVFASDQIGAPGWRFYFDALRQGVIPMWNPSSFAGMPTFDAMFGDAAYPPFLLLGFLTSATHIVTYNFILHTLIAGLGAFVLLNRYFRLPGFVATGLAVAYMLNTNMISHIHAGHTAKFFIMCWLPLSLHFLLRLLTPQGKWFHALGLALTITLFITTSHLQFTYYVLIGYFVIWCGHLIPVLIRKRFSEGTGMGMRFWVPILLGIGLAAPMIYPPIQYTKGFGVRGSNEKQTYEHATSWSMHPEETASLIVPEFGGINQNYWGRNPFKLNSEYAGITVLFLGLLGWIVFRGPFFHTFGTLAVLSVLFGLGANTPMFRLFYALMPGVKQFRAPSMMMFWFATALLVMSAETIRRLLLQYGEGMESQQKNKVAKYLARFGFGFAGLLLVAGVIKSLPYGIWEAFFSPAETANYAAQAGAAVDFSAGAIRAAILVAALTFATRTLLLNPAKVKLFASLLLAVTFLDLIWVNSNFIQGYPPNQFLPNEPAIAQLKADTSEYRVFGLPRAYDRWFMGYHGIETVDGWTDNETRIFREFRGNDYQNNPNFVAGLKQNAQGAAMGSPFLDMLNVKYIAFKVPQGGGLQLAPYISSLPRAYWIGQWKSEPIANQVATMLQPGFDPHQMALVDDSAGLGDHLVEAKIPEVASADSTLDSTQATVSAAPDVATPGLIAATRVSRTTNAMEYAVNAPTEGILVLNDLWFPNWKVKVDGQDAPLLRVNFAFRGAKIAAGNHHVRFEYHSAWIRNGFWMSLACLVLQGIFVFLMSRFQKAAFESGNAIPAKGA